MRNPSILSTPPGSDRSARPSGATASGPVGAEATPWGPGDTTMPAPLEPAVAASSSSPARAKPRFDACRIGVVLRTVLAVEAAVALATLFVAAGPADWLTLAATVTGGALPGTLLWLVLICAAKKLLARWPLRVQYAVGAVIGALAGLYGCGLLRLTGVMVAAPWLASGLTGAAFAAMVMVAMVLRASGETPAATTARLEELQQRIRPHFLFNTLNSAIALVREEPAKAEAMLEDLSELFRSALADPDESVTLGDEIALAQRYLVTLGAGYALYLLVLRWWAQRLVEDRADVDPDAGDVVDVADLAGNFVPSYQAPLRAGARVAGESSSASSSGVGDAAGGVLDALSGADEGAVVVVPVLAIFLIGAAVVTGAGALALLYFGWDALLAVAVEVAFSYVAARAAVRVTREGWLTAAVRLTWKPLLGALLCAVLLGWSIDHFIPQANSLPGAVRAILKR